jgi:hypothetical protein
MYDLRVHKTRREIGYAINRDLRTLNIKNIVKAEKNGEKLIYVFTRNSKEFVFVDGKVGLVLKTVIKRNPDDTKRVLNKRKALVTV